MAACCLLQPAAMPRIQAVSLRRGLHCLGCFAELVVCGGPRPLTGSGALGGAADFRSPALRGVRGLPFCSPSPPWRGQRRRLQGTSTWPSGSSQGRRCLSRFCAWRAQPGLAALRRRGGSFPGMPQGSALRVCVCGACVRALLVGGCWGLVLLFWEGTAWCRYSRAWGVGRVLTEASLPCSLPCSSGLLALFWREGARAGVGVIQCLG